MIGAVPSGRNGFGNARWSMFPTRNETAGIHVLFACAIQLPPPPLSVRDVTKRKWRLRSRKRFVCCSLRSMNQLFLFSGLPAMISEWSHLPTALRVGITSFRETSAGLPRVSEESVERVRRCFLRNPKKSVRHASRELEMSTMTVRRALRKRLEMKPYRLHLVKFLQSFCTRWI
jgi:hypothetical protein